MNHETMRHWASITRPTVGPRPKPATQKLQEAIAERREHQKVLAQDYAERRKEAAAAARDFRDRMHAAMLAKAAERNAQRTTDTAANETPANRDMGAEDDTA